jgi:hypothetical protein
MAIPPSQFPKIVIQDNGASRAALGRASRTLESRDARRTRHIIRILLTALFHPDNILGD